MLALIIGASTALAFQQAASVQVAVDLNTDGNSGTAVGTIDSCRSVSAGDTFDIDVVVRGVPATPAPGAGPLTVGLASFGFNIHFDPAVVNITGAVNSLMLGGDSAFQAVQANYVDGGNPNPFPATSGDTRIDFVDLSSHYESGDGVLSRLTIKAIGTGRTDVTLNDETLGGQAPELLRADAKAYKISQLQNAAIAVGQPCDSAPTPFDPVAITPKPTPSPSPNGSASPTATLGPSGSPATTPVGVPAGNTALAVDADTTGNDATHVGTYDSCGRAEPNETFQVDVVIQGVSNLLAWSAPITYDPKVLEVEDRNVKLFQAANAGSQVFDASNQTPNGTGTYVSSAFDAADPASPDSGDGVLVRLTLKAIGSGTSQLSLAPVDLNGDGNPDQGVLLRTVDSAIIGDTNGDTFFDGLTTPTEIRVGADCPGGGHVVPAQGPSSAPSQSSGSSSSWIWIVVAAGAIVVVASAAAGVLFMRRRRGSIAP